MGNRSEASFRWSEDRRGCSWQSIRGQVSHCSSQIAINDEYRSKLLIRSRFCCFIDCLLSPRYKNKIVAIKIVNKGDTPEEIAKIEGRFVREVAMLSKVQHKNLVKVHF